MKNYNQLFLKAFLCMQLIGVVSLTTLAQQNTNAYQPSWADMMENPNANFYDIQKAFNSYWAGKDLKAPNATKGKGYKVFKRWESFMVPRVYPTGNLFDNNIAAREYTKYVAAHPNKSLSGNWSVLGPHVPGGSTSNGGYQGPGGAGRVNCITFHPTDANIIWIGTPAGGMWKTENGGQSWQAVGETQLPVMGISSIAINYNSTNTMYVATGDGEAGDTYSAGILKTTDGGATWTTTSLSYDLTQNVLIRKIAMHPTDPNIMIAATSKGIYRTTDGWATNTQLLTDTYYDVEWKPGDANTVYVIGKLSGATKFYKSTDAGATFSATGTGLPTTGMQRIVIAVSAAAPNNVWALAGQSSDQGFMGFYTSTNSGSSFTTTFSSGTNKNLLGWDTNFGDAGGQAFYDLTLAVNPSNASEIYVGGVNRQKSTNGGTSWTCNGYWLQGDPNYQYTHADHHALEFQNSTTLWDGNDGGIFRSSDNGAHWTDYSNNLVIAQVARFGISATNKNQLMAGMQDNGTNLYKNGTWSVVYGGDGCEAICDPSNDNIIYASYVQGTLYRSADQGGSWTDISSTTTETGDWITPYVMHPTTYTTLYAGYTNLWKTTNSGSTWSKKTLPTGGTGSVIAITIAPSATTTIYVAKIDKLYKTTNDGTSFSDITTGLPTASAAITNIAVSKTDANKVWVTFSGYIAGEKVYYSSNGGTSWTNISGTLPNIPANCIVYENNTSDRVYMGMDIGVYYRESGSSDWTLFSTGLPNVIVKELEIYYDASTCNSRLRAATYGRGIWESDLLASGTITYTSSTTTQNTDATELDAVNQQIIGVQVVMSQCGDPVNLTNFNFNTTGTTASTDISNARVFYTGNIGYFSPDDQFGSTVASPSGSFSVSGTQSLAPGTNYFWLTYDIPASATTDHLVDAQCTQITVNGTNQTPSVTSPTGNRQIKDASALGNGNLASYNYGPIYRNTASSTSDFSRYQYLITSSEMSTLGLTNGAQITSISWYKTSSYSTTGNATMKIYMKNSAASALTTGTTWATLTSGATQVYNNTALAIGGESGWIDFSLTPFTYTGGALEIAVDWDISAVAGNPATGPIYWQYTNGYSSNLTIGSAGTSAPTSLSTTTYGGSVRPNVRLEFSVPVNCTPPTTQATAFGSSNIASTSADISWTRGNGTSVLVVARQGSAVSTDPSNGIAYTAGTFGSGSQIGTGNYVVYNGTGNSTTVTGLTTGTSYYFAVYEYFTADNCFNKTELTGNFTTNGPPVVSTTTASSITSTSAQSGGNVTSIAGSTLTAKGVCWGTSTNPTTAGSKTDDIAQGSSTGSFTSSITGLTANTTYYYRAYATNGNGTSYGTESSFTTACGSGTLPLTQGFNATTIPTCWSSAIVVNGTTPPALSYVTSATSPAVTPTEGTHFVSFNSYSATSGGEIRLVSLPLVTTATTNITVGFSWYEDTGYSTYTTEGVTVQWSTDGINWTNATFYQRYNATAGWKTKSCLLPAGASNQTTLYVGFLFHSQYGNNCSLDNLQITGTSSCTQPTTQATGFGSSSVANTSLTASWTRGNGTGGVLVVAKSGSAVNSDPVSGTTYTANAAFGSGTQIGTGNYVVYSGTGTSVNLTALSASTSYYFAVYEYNSGTMCYKISGLTGNVTTTGPTTVTTTTPTSITSTSASGGGNVTYANGTLLHKGVCWGTSANPTTSGNKTDDIAQGTGSGTFTSSITGLSANTTYYVRAYAEDAGGVVYGSEVSFTTSCGTSTLPFSETFDNTTFPPTCWTSFRGTNGSGTAKDWVRTTATPYSGAGAAYVNYENVTQIAQDWLVTPQITLASGSNSLSFYQKQTSATDYGSLYYIKISTTSQTDHATFTDLTSYGETSFGTTYTQQTVDLSSYAGQNVYIAFVMAQDNGDDWFVDNVQITGGLPTVTTASVTNIGSTSADCGGNVTSDGGSTVTARGICWSTSSNPTITDSKTVTGTGTGSFTSSLTGLTPGSTYYVRAYATNASGTAYGSEQTVSTTCSGVFQVPFIQNFETTTFPPGCWTSYIGTNGVGTVQNWSRNTTSTDTYNSSFGSAKITYENVASGLAEDWLVTPAVKLPTGTATLAFYEKQSYTSVYNSNYYIKVSTTSQTSHASFTNVTTYTESGFGTTFTQRTVDLSAYKGQTVYVAFVMTNDDGDNWLLDDIKIDGTEVAPTTQASSLAFASTTTSQTQLSWTRGSGHYAAVFMKADNTGSAAPTDLSSYTAGAPFTTGTQIGSTGWYCVYNGTGTSVTVTNLSAGVTYRAMVCEYNGNPTYEKYNLTASSNIGNVTINKITPTVTTWPTASNITYGDELSNSTLSGGVASTSGTFAFVSPTTTPNAGTASQSVIFTPSDAVTYNTVTSSISVTVDKANTSITTLPTASDITYGQTLANSTLTGGVGSVAGSFAFTTPSTAPNAGTSSQSITFTPNDGANYNSTTGSVSVTVNKANTSISTLPTASDITYGQTLANSTLTGGSGSVSGSFAFTTPSTAPNAGTASQSITFTPTNAANYNSTTGSVSVTVNFATITWNGSAWSPMSPDANTNAVIAGAYSASSDFSCNNLTIASNGSLTINTGVTITVEGNLLIESDATSTGSFINNGTLAASGTTSAQMYLANGKRYYYVSSPLSNATAAVFGNNTELSGNKRLYQFDGNTNNWVRISNETTPLGVMQGYAFKINDNNATSNTTFTFTGTFNQGSLSAQTLNFDDDAVNGVGDFTLIGNPYTSTIDFGTGVSLAQGWSATGAGIDGTIWHRIAGENTTVTKFATYNRALETTSPADINGRYIPAMQAVWVLALGSGVDLSLTSDAQTTQMEALHKNQISQIRLNLSSDNKTDEVLLVFDNQATLQYDAFDSRKFMGAGYSQLYALNQGTKYAIASYPEVNDALIIPLGVNVFEQGKHELSINDFSAISSLYSVYIEDKTMGMFHNLRNGVYTFNGTSGEENNRFVLHITKAATAIDVQVETTSVYVVEQNLYINTPTTAQVNVTNILGQQVAHLKANKGINTIAVPQKGVYLVTVTSNDVTITKKVVVE